MQLQRGPLSLKRTLALGQEIASAVEAAHERGIVHRDLKPANVMVNSAGSAKVLDFGLAKSGDSAVGEDSSLSMSPTRAISGTALGVILGTASYMSPEQARGRPVDRGADVWALGCILFECLTGSQTFPGDTVSDVIARILEREPDWNALPPSTPGRLRDLLRRCLTKEVDARPRDVGDLRRELSAIALEQSSHATLPSTTLPSLAVLYFENLASDEESEYFCAGITEDILTDLSKIRGLRVSSRNAVQRYRGQSVDIPKVAEELGVGAVLEGSVRRAGDRVRITAQLISAKDGFHLWAERYDRTLEDVFGVQEEIAHAIAEALRVTLTPSESKNLLHDRPKDVRAYDLYLKGRERYGEYSRQSLHEALDLFQQAIEVDPKYALAWAGLADVHGQLLQYGYADQPEESKRLGVEAADRAISLNPRLAEGYKAKSLVAMYSGATPEAVREALKKAVEVNPRFTPALINLCVGEYMRGNLAAAERYIRRALEADPQEAFAVSWLGYITEVTRREDEALSLFRRVREVGSGPFYHTVSTIASGILEVRRGHLEAAKEDLALSREVEWNPQNSTCLEAAIAAREGQLDRARELVQGMDETRGLGVGSVVAAASVAIRLGDLDLADRIVSTRRNVVAMPITVRLYPELHPLLELPKFAPRVLGTTLVWPLEAPMIDATRFSVFREVKIESGLPEGPGVTSR